MELPHGIIDVEAYANRVAGDAICHAVDEGRDVPMSPKAHGLMGSFLENPKAYAHLDPEDRAAAQNLVWRLATSKGLGITAIRQAAECLVEDEKIPVHVYSGMANDSLSLPHVMFRENPDLFSHMGFAEQRAMWAFLGIEDTMPTTHIEAALMAAGLTRATQISRPLLVVMEEMHESVASMEHYPRFYRFQLGPSEIIVPNEQTDQEKELFESEIRVIISGFLANLQGDSRYANAFTAAAEDYTSRVSTDATSVTYMLGLLEKCSTSGLLDTPIGKYALGPLLEKAGSTLMGIEVQMRDMSQLEISTIADRALHLKKVLPMPEIDVAIARSKQTLREFGELRNLAKHEAMALWNKEHSPANILTIYGIQQCLKISNTLFRDVPTTPEKLQALGHSFHTADEYHAAFLAVARELDSEKRTALYKAFDGNLHRVASSEMLEAKKSDLGIIASFTSGYASLIATTDMCMDIARSETHPSCTPKRTLDALEFLHDSLWYRRGDYASSLDLTAATENTARIIHEAHQKLRQFSPSPLAAGRVARLRRGLSSLASQANQITPSKNATHQDPVYNALNQYVKHHN